MNKIGKIGEGRKKGNEKSRATFLKEEELGEERENKRKKEETRGKVS